MTVYVIPHSQKTSHVAPGGQQSVEAILRTVPKRVHAFFSAN
jgi:hypothetical protein